MAEDDGLPHSNKKRVRRTPEQARALIIDAAIAVFSSKGPDAAGLKTVAREAGVSHGLITHYFGTYEGLVEATLEHVAETTRAAIVARIMEAGEHTAHELIDMFFEVMMQPLCGRMLGWGLLSGRTKRQDFFARRVLGPKRVADAIETSLKSRQPDATIDRDEIERLLLLVMTVGLGYSVGRNVLWAAFGRRASAQRDKEFRTWLGDLVASRIDVVVAG